MKKLLYMLLCALLLASCGTSKKVAKISEQRDIKTHLRDSISLQEIISSIQGKISSVKDNSIIKITLYYPDSESTGKQNIQAKIDIQRDIVKESRQETIQVQETEISSVRDSTNMDESVIDTTVKVKSGPGWWQRNSVWLLGSLILSLYFILKYKFLKG